MVNPISGLIWSTPAPAAHGRLDRPAIVAAAIAVADSHGVHGLTMAAVAQELGGYTAMALYRYVSNKDGLIDLMLDSVLGEVPLPAGDADWRPALRNLAMEGWELTRRHPWYARLVQTRPPLGPNSLRRTEVVLAVLTAAGLHTAKALSYLALLDRHVYSAAIAAAEETAMLDRLGLDSADLSATITALQQHVAATGRYPLLARWMSAPQASTWEDQLDDGLNFILDGIAGQVKAGR